MKGLKFWAAAAAVTLATVAGCSAGAEHKPAQARRPGEKMLPLVEQFKEARGRAKSDFERAALDKAIEAGKIDPADYEEAFNRYRRCAQDAGVKEGYQKQPNGIYKVLPTDIPADQKSVDAYLKTTTDCADNAGLIRIEALFRTQVDNPDLLADPREVAVRCLVKAGLVPADYTVEKLMTYLRGDMTKVTDFDPANPEAKKCLNAGGLAVEVGKNGGS
ncbi:hypothetical protein [Amycolatopsis sp. NPDC021455]|uniref:hypothetical protein n=1 Tax=Amycolatopsis sp. NPDC021455 TaxID=3154901 RepID=UPI00340A77EA